MISRTKNILINQLSGVLKALSVSNSDYYVEINDWSIKVYLKRDLDHEDLEPLSDWCKKKNVNWEILKHNGDNWKLIVKIWK